MFPVVHMMQAPLLLFLIEREHDEIDFDQQALNDHLDLAVIGGDGQHASRFPFRRILGGGSRPKLRQAAARRCIPPVGVSGRPRPACHAVFRIGGLAGAERFDFLLASRRSSLCGFVSFYFGSQHLSTVLDVETRNRPIDDAPPALSYPTLSNVSPVSPMASNDNPATGACAEGSYHRPAHLDGDQCRRLC